MPYTTPTAADLKMRFPAFTGVADATIEYWLTDARAIVTDAWIEADRAPGEMELAAHSMVKARVAGITADAIADVAAKGVTDFKSASFSASFDSSVSSRAAGTGYASTQYGADFLIRLRRNVGGPFLAGCVTAPGCC